MNWIFCPVCTLQHHLVVENIITIYYVFRIFFFWQKHLEYFFPMSNLIEFYTVGLKLLQNHDPQAVFTSDELKTSGSRKFSRAHSSWRLFCSGVPVSNKRLVVLNSRTISDS